MVQHPGTWGVPPATLWTDPPYQPLGHHAAERTGNQIRLNAKVAQGRDGAWRIDGMQSAKQLLPGERRAYGNRRGLNIADFSNHENVSILA